VCVCAMPLTATNLTPYLLLCLAEFRSLHSKRL